MINVAIENTSVCGANCIMCPRDKYAYKKEHMKQELFEKIVSEVYEIEEVTQIDVCGYGDPLIDPELEKKILFIKNNIRDIRITTMSTCQFLEGEIADFISENVDDLKISNYGLTKNTFEAVHRGSLVYEKVKKNILSFLEREKKPHITMAYLILQGINDHETEKWKQYWEEKVDDIQIWYPHNYGGVMNRYDNILQYDREDVHSCGRIGKDYMFAANGDVLACCMDMNHKMKIGNMYENSFKEIINGDILKKFKEIHASNDFKNCGLICEKCDQILNRKKSLYYSSNKKFQVGSKSQTLN